MRIDPNPTRVCVDEVSFHAPLLSETEFRQHLSDVLPIHVLQRSLCIRRTMGRCCRNSGSDRSGAWKLTSSTHTRAVQKTWTIRNRYGQIHTVICMPPTVSLSDGRRLTGLRSLRQRYRSRGCLYLRWRWRQGSGAVASRGSGESQRRRGQSTTLKLL